MTDRPNNLPPNWDYQPSTNSVICGGCAFRYGAEHPDGDGMWTCPNCGDGNGADGEPSRHLTSEEQKLMHEALRRSSKPVDPT